MKKIAVLAAALLIACAGTASARRIDGSMAAAGDRSPSDWQHRQPHRQRLSDAARVNGFGPWRFGMSQEDVLAESDYGPYRPVEATGGLETFNGQWDGDEANISFVFQDEGLDRIQIWAYEGESRDEALKAWWRVASFLQKTHGAIEFPQFPTFSAEAKQKAFLDYFDGALAEGNYDKLQLGLVQMPADAIVFSSLIVHPSRQYYYVFLYYRRRA